MDASDPEQLVLFPEMDETADVPEITTDCWRILGVDPGAMMCASARMVVKRKGAPAPSVLACTLIPYDKSFELGPRLVDAMAPIKLNHRHCAKFCVLGGGAVRRTDGLVRSISSPWSLCCSQFAVRRAVVQRGP